MSQLKAQISQSLTKHLVKKLEGKSATFLKMAFARCSTIFFYFAGYTSDWINGDAF
jgi:hypothetical protein